MNKKLSMEKFVSMSDTNLAQGKFRCSDVLCRECPICPAEKDEFKFECSVEHITEKIKEYKNIQANIKLVEGL